MTHHQRFTQASTALALTLSSAPVGAQPASPPPAPLDWTALEAPTLRRQTQLTFPARFAKAGEAYFSPDTRWIVFQAVPRPAKGEPPSPHYSMYVAKLTRDGAGAVTGVEEPILISPPGSANTCGWFHPKHEWSLIFGSTLTAPAHDAKAGYQRGEHRYVWQFPDEMEVCSRSVLQIYYDLHPMDPSAPQVAWGENGRAPVPIWRRPGYDAECSYSPDGRFILYTAVDAESGDGDIFVYDTETKKHRPIVVAKGYDGGPFFSPDGRRICYRSDRAGDDLLQLYVGDLTFDADGAPTGLAREHPVTRDENVNWAPFWHPSGAFLVFTTSRIGHDNYEIFSIKAPAPDAAADAALAEPRRITFASGFDGMPAFNADGSLMMWTSQRGPMAEGEERPSSQVWIAEVVSAAP